MPNPNLNDVVGWIEDIKRQIARLKSGAFLENSSISDGMLRLIRATLRLEGGALLKGEGTFDWTGPGSVAGDWEVLGGGVIRVGGVLISPVGGGRIMVGAGPVAIILDGGTGTLTSGDIRMEGGRIYVGTGASQIVIDGATGRSSPGTWRSTRTRAVVPSPSATAGRSTPVRPASGSTTVTGSSSSTRQASRCTPAEHPCP